ncbi:hypothetical protein TSUD_79950 [Trifolium subterraneum]|uniref:Phytocyanin domain-containing protein n=1 Tax=Trifolium subterraneum TaxID=3900 RepID=A0A2Z6MKL5_TRISU|nr:hypothetical protein TSUD_79950 [Trifolium subterraneum]
MALGRGSALVLLVCFFVLHSELAHAATYTVGDAGVFNYSPRAHNVVAVNKGGYDSCKTPAGSKVFRSGKDQIRLARGQNYFICNFVGHCESGMKIAINAA